MKGTNTIIVNSNQMNEIMNKWWDGFTYGTKDAVVSVEAVEGGNFEIVIDEVVPLDEAKS